MLHAHEAREADEYPVRRAEDLLPAMRELETRYSAVNHRVYELARKNPGQLTHLQFAVFKVMKRLRRAEVLKVAAVGMEDIKEESTWPDTLYTARVVLDRLTELGLLREIPDRRRIGRQ